MRQLPKEGNGEGRADIEVRRHNIPGDFNGGDVPSSFERLNESGKPGHEKMNRASCNKFIPSSTNA